MEWIEVTPEQPSWKIQINLIAYYGQHTIGSIVYISEDMGWECVIGGRMDYMDAKTEEEAKTELIDKLESHFENEISYYKELIGMLNEFKQERK